MTRSWRSDGRDEVPGHRRRPTAHRGPGPASRLRPVFDEFSPPRQVEDDTTVTHTLPTPEADIVYDGRGPLPAADGRPPLFMLGQPLVAAFPHDVTTAVAHEPR